MNADTFTARLSDFGFSHTSLTKSSRIRVTAQNGDVLNVSNTPDGYRVNDQLLASLEDLANYFISTIASPEMVLLPVISDSEALSTKELTKEEADSDNEIYMGLLLGKMKYVACGTSYILIDSHTGRTIANYKATNTYQSANLNLANIRNEKA